MADGYKDLYAAPVHKIARPRQRLRVHQHVRSARRRAGAACAAHWVKVGGKVVSNYSALVPGDPSIEVGRGGGIEWTIKEGVPYHVPRLMAEVKEMVARARAAGK